MADDGHELAHDTQSVIDAALDCAKLLGIPPLTLGAAGAKLLIDLGFRHFFSQVSEQLQEARAAKTAGDAAHDASVATSAIEAYKRRVSAALAAAERDDGLMEPSFEPEPLSPESERLLAQGLAEVRAGLVVSLPLDAFEPEEV